MTVVDSIERKLAVVRALVVVNMVLLIGVLWLMCTISGRVPR
jgi:hypothetical protein